MTAIRKGAIGVKFDLPVVDEAGAPVDITAAVTLQILLRKPDGTVLTRTAAVVSGTTNTMRYISVTGDLDLSGDWLGQGYLAIPGGYTGHTETTPFRVRENLS